MLTKTYVQKVNKAEILAENTLNILLVLFFRRTPTNADLGRKRGMLCNKYLRMWKQFWTWIVSRGWRAFRCILEKIKNK